jgi:hypothetical protein
VVSIGAKALTSAGLLAAVSFQCCISCILTKSENSYLCYKDEKENISDDLLEIAERGKAESSNSNESEIVFSSMHHTLLFSRLQ